MVFRKTKTEFERFSESYLVNDNGCWIWQKSKFHFGHGQFGVRTAGKTKNWLAHRWIWQHLNGPIPDGMCICHKCDVPQCVNPEHLFLGTLKDNSQDRNRKGRNADVNGALHPMSKLTPEQIAIIRSRYISGERQCSIAVDFKVSRAHISLIVNGRSWTTQPISGAEALAKRASEGRATMNKCHTGNSKITASDAEEIRRLSKSGYSVQAIGNQFGISSSQVQKIVSGKAWIAHSLL